LMKSVEKSERAEQHTSVPKCARISVDPKPTG